MATISSLGIGSGLDLSSIVDGLVEAERVPTESRLDAKEEILRLLRISEQRRISWSLTNTAGSAEGTRRTRKPNSWREPG